MGWLMQLYEGTAHILPTHDADCERHVLHMNCWCDPDAEWGDEMMPIFTHTDKFEREIDTTWAQKITEA